MALKRLLLTGWVALNVVACAGLGKVGSTERVVYPNEVSDQMRVDFQQADALYQRRDFQSASEAYQKFIDAYGYNQLTDESLYKQGKIEFLKHDFLHAAAKFEELAGKSPDPKYRAKGWHMAGYARHKNVDSAGALIALKKVRPELLEPLLRMQYCSLAIQASQGSGQDEDFADLSKLRLYDVYEERGQSSGVSGTANIIGYDQLKSMLDAWMSKPMSSSSFPAWMRKYPDEPSRALVDYKIAKTYYEEKSSKARRLLSVFVNNHPKSPYFAAANNMLAQIGGPEDVKGGGAGFRVGVLAPLSGAAGYTEDVLRGIRCAAGEGGMCGTTSNVEIVVRDSGMSPDTVRQALDQLAGEGVASVISILPGTLAVEAAGYSAQKGVPILMISQQEGLMRQGAGVFQLGLTPERQILELVDAAFGRGLKSFAVFYPSIPYGQKMTDLFTKEVTARGGRVLSSVSYPKGGASEPYAEAQRLKKEIDMAKSPDASGVDGVFVPDTYSGVNSAAATLASNQVSGMPLIGTNTWNDPGLSSAIASTFPGSFFVDLYDGSAGGEVQDFRQRYLDSFGTEPQNLSAMGYDAMMILRTAVASEGEKKIRQALDGKVSFRGVTGISGFRAGEEPIIRPRVIMVQEFTAGSF
jgi:ABC-type branched-subunit amino acid transport system substrate-binding protein/TolA-binding protein